MSDLHNLSAPIEDTPEETSQKQEVQKKVQSNQSKEDVKKIIAAFKERYMKKLFLSLGIAVTVCIVLIVVISQLSSQNTESLPENTQQIEETTTNSESESSTKFIKFEGHQYFFYVPENFSFLNRTRNDDLNEIVFSYDTGETAFILQEFEADNHNEETLDSIYAYIFTTLPADENTEVKIGENVFKKRVYKGCPAPEETTESNSVINDCIESKTYYSTYVNGIIIIFETNTNSPDQNIAETILTTYSPNLIDSEILTKEYAYSKIPSIENKLEALYALGIPLNKEESPLHTNLTWETTEGLKVQLTFDTADRLIALEGSYEGQYRFNLLDDIANESIPTNIPAAYGTLISSVDIDIDANSDVFIAEDPSNDNFWIITVASSQEEDALLLAEYSIDKTSGKIQEISLN